ncbi:hypothetical protein AJ79_04063 [Helicocarpus griseus UAMH5409]|uniref:FAD-binding PCMH-type domain-containing protein n=1 Tax=Helicocarpus griseus UAMH5409 TaxID=1447875 RepID=A0A2B7XVA2_9EURO|nr:hypothetical protein AJ79_04063 [Helicocarpus griseus UAMH5409]
MKHDRLLFAAAVAANLLPVFAQDPSAVTPAVTKVTPGPGDHYFEFETLQLVEESLNQLEEQNKALFNFGDPSVTPPPVEKRDDEDVSYCKVFPGDPLWPRPPMWDIFNRLLGGGLIPSLPMASACYEGEEYDAERCEFVEANFNNSYVTTEDPIEILAISFQGMTCMPTTDPTGSCTLGGYPAFAVDVSNVAQVQLAVNFARNSGIRLIVKNTGHDFSGKSAGAGSLSIWTHNLKDMEFIPEYSAEGTDWTGPAIKAGSGVQAYDLYEFCNQHGVVTIGGEGQTVGITGGYIQGGGHSPLSSIYGMGADHVLEMEVVTPDGHFVTASKSENEELFWALRGGGGSTYGVVTSMTLKARPDMKVTTTTFTFTSGGTVTKENFWQGVRYFFDYFIPFTDAGTYSYFFLMPAGPEDFLFLMQPFFAPQMSIEETETLLGPWFTQLADLGITVQANFTHHSTFHAAWSSSFPLEVIDKRYNADGSRLFPRANWEDKETLDATFNAWKTSIEKGIITINFNIAPTLARGNFAGGDADNSVNPAWRETVMHSIQSISWAPDLSPEEILEVRDSFTNGDMQRWRDVSPGAGSYLGEADRIEPNFQQAFYGSHYERLLALKKKVDPWDVFWAATAVGSEGWEVVTENGLPHENGRLCRVEKVV